MLNSPSNPPKIEFCDLQAQYKHISESLNQRLNKVLAHGKFILGPEVEELERKLAQYVDMPHCISCANGTDAMLLLLMALGVTRGDIVFVPTFTFIATAEVVSLVGATPIFVDIDRETFNINPELLRSTIKKHLAHKTDKNLTPKAIIAVDLYGQPADYDELNSVAKEFDLFLIEDAAQSFGAKYQNKKACSLAHSSATSFFPSKPLGCYGDGGAIFCKDEALALILRSIRNHGQGSHRYEHVRLGLNSRLDTLQAAVLLEKLTIFNEELSLRQKVADSYSARLADAVSVPSILPERSSAWAQYSILCENRDEIAKHLLSHNIPTAIHYPKPLHLQKAFAHLGWEEGSLPVSEHICSRILSLPMHPYLTEEQIEYITGSLLECLVA